jgi:osmoprotectant transport system permease protein
LRRILRQQHGLELLDSYGFNNTYALAVRREHAERFGLRTIADLRAHPDLRFGFSHEFFNRSDGWPGLAEVYGFAVRPLGIEHGLIYQAITEGKVDVIDVYSTDAEIQRYGLVVLEDNLRYFPTYLAAPLLRVDLDPRVAAVLSELAGTLDETRMQRLNAAVSIDKKSFAEVAHDFLRDRGLLRRDRGAAGSNRWSLLAHRTVTHIKLTLIAVLAGMAVAIPFGMLIYRVPALSRPVLYVAGLLQTIPSIALLAFMIPLFGIGVRPAIVALFLYALLPIVRNTYAALQSIDPVLKKVAVGMGLTAWQRLRHVELPLAMPTILAGVRTTTVINIGTATLAAFIGAGGLGEPIVTGLALNDTSLILEGAVPAAILAIVAELVFEASERLLIPKHLLR